MNRRKRLVLASHLAVAGLCCLSAFFLTFGRLIESVNADTLMSCLISFVHWTPFAWEQNRFGSLLPWLAQWLRHPLYNYVAQTWLNCFLGVTAFFLAATLVVPGRRGLLAGAVGFAAWILFFPALATYNYFYIGQPYAASIALFLAAAHVFKTIPVDPLLSLKPWKSWLLISAGLFLAHWVNLGVAPAGFALIALYAWQRKRWRWALFGAAATLAFAANWWIMQWARYPDKAQTQSLSFGPWLNNLFSMTRLLWEENLTGPAWNLGVLAVAGALLAWGSWSGLRRAGLLRSTLPFWGAGIFFYLLVADMKWVEVNGHSPRYITHSLFFFFVGLGIAMVAMIPWKIKAMRRSLGLFLFVLLLLPPVARYGLPSTSLPRRFLEERFGAYTAQILEWNPTGIIGDYWRVWPTVFHVHWKQLETGKRSEFYGLSHRSFSTRHMWEKLMRPGARLVALEGDSDLEKYLDLYQVSPVRELERKNGLVLMEIGQRQ